MRLWILFFLVLLGLAIRLDHLIASNWVIDADEAIVGLMAKHMQEGAPIPTFYYGQHYMGSLEAILVRWIAEIVGMNEYALKLVPLSFALLLIVLVALLGHVIGGPMVGTIAGLLTALPPQSLVVWSTKARGGFIETLVLGAAALLLAIIELRRKEPRKGRTFLIVLLLGLGWWVNNQIIYFYVPVALGYFLYTIRDRKLFASLFAVGVFGWTLGSLPFWSYNFANDFVSFEIFGSDWSKLDENLVGVFSASLPMLFGARNFWQEFDLFPGALGIALVLNLSLLGIALVTRNRDRLLLAAMIVAALVIFGGSTYGYLVQAPRYLLPLYIPMYILIACALVTVARWSPAVTTLLLVLILAINVHSSYPMGERSIPGEPYVFNGERVSRDHTELIRFLDAKNIRYVRTNYWIGYRLAFETNERVRFRVFGEPAQERIPEYQRASEGRHKETLPLILVRTQEPIAARALKALGFEYQRAEASNYVIFYDIRHRLYEIGEDGLPLLGKKIALSELSVTASHAGEVAAKAIDADETTRWGSAHPQRPGMSFSVTLKAPRVLRALHLELAAWHTDFPRGLSIAIETESGEVRDLLTAAGFDALSSYLVGQGTTYVYFPDEVIRRIVLTQTRSDPVFDWSIAELELFEPPARAP